MDSVFLKIMLCVMLLTGPVLSPLYCGAHHHFLTERELFCANFACAEETSELDAHPTRADAKPCACAHSRDSAKSKEAHSARHVRSGAFAASGSLFFSAFGGLCSIHETADPCESTAYAEFLGNGSLADLLFSLFAALTVIWFFLRAAELLPVFFRNLNACREARRDEDPNSARLLRLHLLKNVLLN